MTPTQQGFLMDGAMQLMQKRKVAIINSHPVVLRGLAQVIDHEADLNVCAEIDEPSSALRQITATKPDIIMVDISEKEVSKGIDLVKTIRVEHPNIPILVLSMHNESFYAEIAFRAGARGYIAMTEPTAQILTAVRRALVSGVYVSEKMAVDIVARLVNNGRSGREGLMLYGFTDREFEVFEYIGRGLTIRQIAEKLHRSVKTVEAHREHIKKKLKLENTTELVRHAIHWVEYQKTAT